MVGWTVCMTTPPMITQGGENSPPLREGPGEGERHSDKPLLIPLPTPSKCSAATGQLSLDKAAHLC